MGPRLRPLDAEWIDYHGQRLLRLSDPLRVSPRVALLPQEAAYILSLCNGERDIRQISDAVSLSAGLTVTASQVDGLIGQLDEALFLDSPRFAAGYAEAISDYRAAPCRPPSFAGASYPADAGALRSLFDGYRANAKASKPSAGKAVRGLLSPHIDYQRGSRVYAQVWEAASEAVQEADVAVVIGTDHHGSPGSITLTRQPYATPLGVLPIDETCIDAMVHGTDIDLFAGELHHRFEHSIELAAVWLHYHRGGEPLPMVPILVGSFHHVTSGESDVWPDPVMVAVTNALREAIQGRRCLVVSAGDMAHVGPAFGDDHPLGDEDKASLEEHDQMILSELCHGDAERFFETLRRERDARRVCGLPPTYLALRLLGACSGRVEAYGQCPADTEGGSIVSIGGMVWR